MIHDEIVDEVRRIRRQTEEACGHDWQRLMAHYRQVQSQVPPDRLIHAPPPAPLRRKRIPPPGH